MECSHEDKFIILELEYSEDGNHKPLGGFVVCDECREYLERLEIEKEQDDE